MRFRRKGPRPGQPAPPEGGRPRAVEISVTTGPYPPCSQCGRTQFPLVGGWDPPICQDCDAAINEDAMWGEELPQ